jgi:hypothetical protein
MCCVSCAWQDPGTGPVFAYTKVWDADKVYGCRCDEGFYGPDCSQRHCPRGDDPLTGTAIDPAGVQRNEVQTFTCRADGGFFTLSFRGFTTAPVYWNDDLAELQAKLLALPSLRGADIETASTAGVCTPAGNLIQVTPPPPFLSLSSCSDHPRTLISAAQLPDACQVRFTQDFGDLPLLVGDARKLKHATRAAKLAIKAEIDGSKEDAYCSGRGTCSALSGVCDCFDHYFTSNGSVAPVGVRTS